MIWTQGFTDVRVLRMTLTLVLAAIRQAERERPRTRWDAAARADWRRLHFMRQDLTLEIWSRTQRHPVRDRDLPQEGLCGPR